MKKMYGILIYSYYKFECINYVFTIICNQTKQLNKKYFLSVNNNILKYVVITTKTVKRTYSNICMFVIYCIMQAR